VASAKAARWSDAAAVTRSATPALAELNLERAVAAALEAGIAKSRVYAVVGQAMATAGLRAAIKWTATDLVEPSDSEP